MSAEQTHITKESAGIAVASGILMGIGVVFPPAAGLGVAVGAVGFVRERSHQQDMQMKNMQDYIKSNTRVEKVPNPYTDRDKFRLNAFKRIPGVVNIGRKMDNDDTRDNSQ